jgi:chemotaxis protein methyltransferase CheR
LNGYNLSFREFNKFRELIHNKTGISLGDQKRDLVISRLTKRLRILNIKTFDEYYHYVLKENNNEEITAMINRITTNVTSFFREGHHFRVLRETVLPRLLEKKSANKTRKIRIWSAGCSTGQEPYSIAITLADFFQGRLNWDIKILATDLDTDVLSTGEKGIYPESSVCNISSEQLRRYFKKGIGENKGIYQISNQIKNMVVFRRLNLTLKRFPIRGPLDIIFCRNVIIYFSNELKIGLIKKFNQLLDDDGYLFMGHSESLIAMKEKFRYIHNTVYQKDPLFLNADD